MEQQRTALPYLLLIVFIILMLHLAGLYLYLYWRLFWYDNIVHILGGLWISLVALSLFFSRGGFSYKKALMIAIVAMAIVGIGWEFFELYAGATSLADPRFVGDTAGDLACDMAGGLLAVPLFKKFFT